MRNSTQLKIAVMAIPPISNARTTGSSQPRAGASIIPRTNRPIEPAISAVPGRSSGVASVSFDVTIVNDTTRMRTETTARLTKIECQDHFSRSSPETTSPAIAPDPATPDQTPTARARCAGGKPAVSRDSVAGMTNAAPTPEITRETMIHDGSSAKTGIDEPAAKTSSPNMSSSRRPYRSPSAPAGNKRQASVSVYPSTIHVSWLCVAPVSRAKSGRAVLSAAIAATTSATAQHATVSIQICRMVHVDCSSVVSLLTKPPDRNKTISIVTRTAVPQPPSGYN